ncbi:MAG: ABC transporter substrate-binding protein, partial [Halopseudomonas sp.]
MSDSTKPGINRRTVLKSAAGLTAAATFLPSMFAIGGQAKVKVGLLLPHTGTYAKLGNNIKDALELRIEQAGGKLGGREVEIVSIDSEAKPPKASELTNKLIKKENVDFLVGPVHSVVGMSMVKLARKNGIITVIPNAGANQ